ncbi:hypothetical protein [Nocardiopsis ganjiahuensis]|uniref:hypothetical protein n=1 Tax=Nocardiopsis ganjiahuensis TaxID=239984 RepID=UPI0003467423|nr:hypothetical protein [Nocardiopsis ganjiahuensis]
MGDTAKIVAAAIGGYVLGRKKKFKLALGLGIYLGAKKLDIKPQQLAQGLLKEVSSLPVVGELKGQSREQLLNVGKAAAGNLVGKWADGLADSLNSRTELLRQGAEAAPGGETEDGRGEEEEGASGQDDDAEARQGPEADEDGDDGRKRPAKTRSKAVKTARGTASGAAKRTKSAAGGGARRASGTSGKPARRKSSSNRKDGEGDDGRD